MNNFKNSHYFFPVLLLLLLVVNVLQSVYTELIADEAYYWVYSQDMAFGYFDHPPVVSAYIWLGSFLSESELGVRIVAAVAFTLIFLFVWKTIDHPKKEQHKGLFALLFLSTVLLNVYGFVTVPDTPLMLFVAFFLWSYKQYLKRNSLLNCLWLGIAMAGMLYSKYQAVLIIFFVLISNIKVVRDPKVWLSTLITILLFFPHLYWQYINDFPSIRYHLYERASTASYKVEDTLLHFVNAIVIVGFTFVVMYKAFFRGLKRADTFRKALNYIIVGFFLFFLLSSFRGHVQAQWLAPMILPLILITFPFLVENPGQLKLFHTLAAINIVIIIAARVFMASESISPVRMNLHGNKAWALHIKENTKNVDKLFINSYQNASIYWFYSKERPHYQKNFLGRKNQYGLIKDNEVFMSDSIAHVTRVRDDYSKIGIRASGKDSVFVSFVRNYKSISNIEVTFMHPPLRFKEGLNDLYVTINNPNEYNIDNLELFLVFQNKKANDTYSIPLKKDFTLLEGNSMLKARLSFNGSLIHSINEFPSVGIGARTSEKMELVKLSQLYNYKILD